MEIGKTIRARRKEMGLTLDKLSELAGCSKPYLSTIETGKANPPGRDILLKLETLMGFKRGSLLELAYVQKMPPEIRETLESQHLENVKLRQIIRTIISGYADGATDMVDQQQLDYFDDDPSHRGFVPVINKVAAGYPVDFDDMGYPVGFADDYIKCLDIADPNAFAVRIIGDSMMPDYCEGNIVVFSPSRAVDNGDDCFIRFSDPHETTFKQVYFQEDGSVMLQPRNKKYSPFVAPPHRVNGIYKAVMKYQPI